MDHKKGKGKHDPKKEGKDYENVVFDNDYEEDPKKEGSMEKKGGKKNEKKCKNRNCGGTDPKKGKDPKKDGKNRNKKNKNIWLGWNAPLNEEMFEFGNKDKHQNFLQFKRTESKCM